MRAVPAEDVQVAELLCQRQPSDYFSSRPEFDDTGHARDRWIKGRLNWVGHSSELTMTMSE